MKLVYHKPLDGVRAVAAWMVMFFHFFIAIQANNSLLMWVKKIAVFGQTGVSLFFVLSGFLITRILLNDTTNKHYFYHFYMRRSLRIFPLYYLFLILYYWVFPIILQQPSSAPSIYHWFYLQDIAMTFKWPMNGPDHFWSLAVEEHFYLFWPLVVYFCSPKRLSYWIAGILLVSIATRWYLIQRHLEVFYFTFTRMDELAIGALLAIAEAKKMLTPKHARKYVYLSVGLLLPALGFWLFMNGKGNTIVQLFKCVAFAGAYWGCLGFLIASKETVWVRKSLQHPFLLYTGKISYGLYVYHPFCFLWYERHTITNSLLLNFVICCGLAYAIASLSYYLIEQQFLQLKKYFA